MNREITTILSIFGTRPEAIKMAPVIRELEQRGETVCSKICVTGQHREMLDQTLELYRINPDFDLDIMEPDQTLGPLTGRLFEQLDPIIASCRPDWIIAQGDTTSTLVAALSAFYRHVRFGHVEAGLRTEDKHQPFPEEMNRRVADLAADALFAPTERSRQALLKEGVPARNIHLTGNTVVDALNEIVSREYHWDDGPLSSLPRDKKLVLITAHRRESFGEPFRHICEAVREMANRFVREGIHFVYPAHLNPNVQKPVSEILTGIPNLSVIPPLDYLSLVHLMKQSILILTDSGGIQEEAPGLGTPVLVLRDKTERPEGIEANVAKQVGTDREKIVEAATFLLTHPEARQTMVTGKSPYGDGHAAKRIVDILLRADSNMRVK